MQTLRILSIACLVLTGCNHYASMEGVTPNVPAARFNAQLALTSLKRGDTENALKKLKLAHAQGPEDPLVLDSMGYYYEVSGNTEKANSYYAGAMIEAPDSGTVINAYGAFLCRQGYYSTSIPFFLRAAKTHYAEASRAYANARYCASRLNHELGDHSEYAYYNKLLWKTSSTPTD